MVPFFVGLVAGRMDHSHSHSRFQARTHARLARVRPTPSTKVLPGPPFVPGGCRSEMPLRAVTRLHVSAWFRGDCIETAATTLRRGNGARDRGGAMFLLRQLCHWPINAALCRPATTWPWSWVLRLATEKAATWSTAGATRSSMDMPAKRRHRSMAWMARYRPLGRLRLTGACAEPGKSAGRRDGHAACQGEKRSAVETQAVAACAGRASANRPDPRSQQGFTLEQDRCGYDGAAGPTQQEIEPSKLKKP